MKNSIRKLLAWLLIMGLLLPQALGLGTIPAAAAPAEASAEVEWPDESETDPAEKVNLALNKPATASKEALDQGVHRVAGLAVDGDESTRWYDGDIDTMEGNWLQVDLGARYGLDEIEVLWADKTVAQKYEIQVSDDGKNWQHIYTVDSQRMFDGALRHTFNVFGAGQYVRVYVLERGTWGNSICELKVYGDQKEHLYSSHIDAEDATLLEGTAGAPSVLDVKEACGGQVADGFYVTTDQANDGAGVEFVPENLSSEARTYLLYVGYARYFYEKADTIGVYVNGERVKTLELRPESDNVDLTIRSAPVELELKQGDKVALKVDAESGDHGYLRLDYINLGLKVNRPSRDMSLVYPKLALNVDETARILVEYQQGSELEFFAEDETIAAFEGDVLTAKAEGVTRIMARDKNNPVVYAIGQVAVGGAVLEGSVTPVRELTLKEETLTVANRQSVQAEATTNEGAGTHLLWESSDPAVATVADGKITGMSAGTATITVKSALNEELSDSLTVTVTNSEDVDTLKSDELEVLVSKSFPMVYQYKTSNGGVVQGNPNQSAQIKLNGELYTPQVAYEKVDDATAKYTLKVSELNAVITMTLKAEDSNFKLEVTEIKEDGADDKRIFTFDMPDNIMLSMTNKEAGASFAGSKMETDISKTGDVYYDLAYNKSVDSNPDTSYLYAFLSNEKASAGFWGNAMDAKIRKQTTKLGDTYTTALWSGEWRYRADDYTKTFQDTEGDYGPAGEVVTRTYKATYTEDLPKVYISFAAGDLNDSGSVDWQDGAIAFREIMPTAIGMEKIPDAVVQRLVFPQSGEGNYPYISSLDETKRVYLATDGLGQLILNKYHNEGTWGDLGVYDEFLGGQEDFNKYVSDSVQMYNSWVGVHTNFTEIYAKARAFRPEKIMMQEDGITPVGYGFAAYSHWLQQVYSPDITFDAISLERQGDLKAFAEAVPDLGFVYSDVFSGGGWKGRRLAEDYEAAGLAYFVEWPYQNEEEAVWSHWAVEKVYSPANLKAYASDIARFIFNHTKDRWDNNADYENRYPNSCNLLMGTDTTTYEGWPQANTNNGFDKAIQVVFDNNLPTKYMQHFPILRMEKDAQGWATHIWFEDNVEVYLNENGKRIIEKDGKVIYNQDSYLIPWDEGDIDNPEDEQKEVKLYHYNENGGTTTWQLPNSWSNVETVYLYKLTDQGKTGEKEIRVEGGSITIENAEKQTPYVIYKGKAAPEADVNYGDGSYVDDPGFNYGNLDDSSWTVDKGEPKVKKNDASTDTYEVPNWCRSVSFDEHLYRNYELVVDDAQETQVSQEITGLEPGQYAVSVMVEVEQGKTRRASVIVDNGEETFSGYTDQSILMNFDEYDSKLGTYMLRMRVNFEVPEGKNSVTIKLHAAAGDGVVRFDNVRIFETAIPTPDEDYAQDKVIFYQDFELAEDSNASDPLTTNAPTYEGHYPFNLGAARGIHETRISIQKAHAPFSNNGTQMWDPSTVHLDDTLDGERALKVIGIDQPGIAVQTLPQNIRFEKGKSYRVTFLYQTDPTDDYAFVLGDGQPNSWTGAEKNNPSNLVYCETLEHTSITKTYSHEFVATSDELWFGIYRQKVSVSVMNNPAPIVLDNILVEEIAPISTEEHTVTVNGGTGSGSYISGSLVKVEATIPEGKAFASWTAEGVTLTEAQQKNPALSFTMPKNDVTLTAEFAEIPVSQNKPAEASLVSGKNVADNAFDGNLTTRWYDGEQKPGNWLAVNLENVYDLSKVEIYWDATGEPVYAYEYSLQVSDNGVDYETFYHGTCNDDGPVTVDVSEVQGQYVRLYIDKNGMWGTAVMEMKVYGTKVETVTTHDVTYTLTHVTAANQPATVEDGKTLNATLTAENGYKLPDTITVTMGGAATQFTYDKTTGAVTVEKVTGDVEITAVGVKVEEPVETHNVIYTLTHVTANNQPATVEDGKTLTATLTAESGYKLPDTITVSMGSAAAQFTYDNTTGAVTVKNVTGDVEITAVGVKEEEPVETHTITLRANGGTVNPKKLTVKHGETADLPVPTRSGSYEFEGWFTANNVKVTDKTPIMDDMILYAHWNYTGGIHVKPEEPDQKPETPVVDTDFIDVRPGDWYYDAVAYVSENGIMTGVAEGVFNPDGTVTRAMVWTVLARMDGVNTEGGSTWYAKAQTWAIDTGVSDGTDPNGAITREQLAAMLYRFEGSPAVTGNLSAYPDAASVSDWAEDAMVWATETGLINGINGYLKPQDGATRAQLATMLMRMLES